MKFQSLLIISLAILAGCRNGAGDADAFGNFEATEVIISSESNGRILKFDAAEGSLVENGSDLVYIDTTLLHLQMNEIDAAISSIRSRLSSITAQNEILNQQIANLKVNITRIENMLKDDAATKKQYDDLTGQVEVIQKQIAANNTQKSSILAEASVYQSKKATLAEQISRCTVRSPLKGTLIEKYSEAGELTSAGKPLAKIADLSVMKLKVYISGGQLGNVKLGQLCTARIDSGEKGFKNYSGTVSHISEKAEFTPKIIQTKEERVTLVYAVTIAVPNDGSLKSGMPGEAVFGTINQ